MSQLFTHEGDDGYTGRLGEGKIAKEHGLVEAIGAIDEASAALGLARAVCKDARCGITILEVQRDLYHMMAEVSATRENAAKFRQIEAARVRWVEEQAESLSETIAIPKEFIVSGDTLAGAALDLARSVVRRAERHVAGLFHAGEIENQELLRYLNRLSSLCFVLEFLENQISGSVSPTLAKEDK